MLGLGPKHVEMCGYECMKLVFFLLRSIPKCPFEETQSTWSPGLTFEFKITGRRSFMSLYVTLLPDALKSFSARMYLTGMCLTEIMQRFIVSGQPNPYVHVVNCRLNSC